MAEFSRRDFFKLGVATLFSIATLRRSNPLDLTQPSLPEHSLRRDQCVTFIMPTKEGLDEDVKIFEDAVGHRVQGLSFFADLDENLPDRAIIENTLTSGRAVMINLQPRPTNDAEDKNNLFSANSFLEGQHDDTLESLGKMMASFGDTPIFVRFAFEMNGDWVSWGGERLNYVNMWRHVVNTVREAGGSNVKWIFSPNYNPEPENVGEYYPGGSFVDVVGGDIYDWENLSPGYAVNRINYYLKKTAPKKPLIVSELGASGPDRDEWLSRAIYLNLAQGATAINYFQIDKERHWKIDSHRPIPNLRRIFGSGVFLNNEADLTEINNTILSVN